MKVIATTLWLNALLNIPLVHAYKPRIADFGVKLTIWTKPVFFLKVATGQAQCKYSNTNPGSFIEYSLLASSVMAMT